MPFRLLVIDEFAPQYREYLQGVDATVDCACTREEAGALIGTAQAIAAFATMLDDALLAQARALRWVQALSSGVDRLLRLPSLRPEIAVTNVRGVHGPFVAEMALLLMSAASRRLPLLLSLQAAGVWKRHLGTPLHGKTVGIAGLGDIGSHIARYCRTFDMSVIGFGSKPRRDPEVDRFHLYSELAEHVGILDFLVLVVPMREDTRGLIDAAILRRMKPTAILVNVGRGGTVNENDLIAALTDRTIAAAALDAHASEPLPASSPLWRMDNVILTPHVAGYVDDYAARVAPVIRQNLQAMAADRTDALVNRIIR